MTAAEKTKRQESKPRAREERARQEQEAAARERRRKRFAYAAGALLAVAVALIVVLALIATGDEGDGGSVAATGASGGAEAGHIHGMGINPADDSLFIATHNGLFIAATGSPPTRHASGPRTVTSWASRSSARTTSSPLVTPEASLTCRPTWA